MTPTLRGLRVALLAGSLAACQASPSSAPAALNTAPPVHLKEHAAFDGYVREQLDSMADRRRERLAIALEPAELDQEIAATEYSSLLDKKRDRIEAHFTAGEEMFEYEFTPLHGMGSGIGGQPPAMHRVHRGAHGGPDTTSCRSCHHRGGDDGSGEYTENALVGGDGENIYHANERNAPPLLGGGALQILAREISAALHSRVAATLDQDYTAELIYQDVNFGTVTHRKDGTLDTSQLRSVDPDLIVRPFGWKGSHSTLRRFAEEAFQVHHGMQSEALLNHRRYFGPMPQDSSPATDAVFKALGDGPDTDPDRDGVFFELSSEFLTSMSVYLTLLPMPVIEPPRAPDLLAAWRAGEATFRSVGCASCHKPFWTIKDPVWQERDDTTGEVLKLDLRKDIRKGPRLITDSEQGYLVYVFSDLRRHDMGEELKDAYPGPTPRQEDRSLIRPSVFMTRPLWGLADSGPYLHDGRASTIAEAILAHGGEGAESRDAYRKLSPAGQRALHVFLLSLTRPPVPEVMP